MGVVTVSHDLKRIGSAELQLEHASVSRRHATLAISEGAIMLADLGSHNGTRINGELVDNPRSIASGDVVTIGEVVCVVHVSEPAAPSHCTPCRGPRCYMAATTVRGRARR